MKNNFFMEFQPPPEKLQQVFEYLQRHYENRPDPWGLDLEVCKKYLHILYPLYSSYFRVRVFGIENVKDRPYMLVANHTGQLPFDGLLIGIALLMEVNPPRILRAMVERFLAGLPFLGQLAAQTGSVLGERQNCQLLMERGESILVFPEGVKGIAKNTSDFYQLRPFTKGFFRLAVGAKMEILPIAVVGAEEAYPYVYHSRSLAKVLGLPAFPLTPFFPLLGPLGLLPFPSPIDIYIGTPYQIPTDILPEAPDRMINFHINKIENQIREMTEQGRKNQRPFLPSSWSWSLPSSWPPFKKKGPSP